MFIYFTIKKYEVKRFARFNQSLHCAMLTSFFRFSSTLKFEKGASNWRAWKGGLVLCKILANYNPAVRPAGEDGNFSELLYFIDYFSLQIVILSRMINLFGTLEEVE